MAEIGLRGDRGIRTAAADIVDQNAADNEISYSSKVKLSPSVLMTAQRDLGVGATLSFSF